MALSWFKNHQTADVLVYMIDGTKKTGIVFDVQPSPLPDRFGYCCSIIVITAEANNEPTVAIIMIHTKVKVIF